MRKRSRWTKTRPRTIDEYLEKLSPATRAALERLRKAIHAAATGAEECISYSLPAFRLDGALVAGFGASANHCSYYPMSGSVVETLAKDLKTYGTSKGTIRFPPDAPLAAALVRKLVRARIAEHRRAK